MDAWRLDEGAHAGPEHLDPGYVAGYERKAGYDPTADVEVLLAHGIGADSVVVDLAAGTGVFARAMAPHCRQVIAVDVSPAMVAALRTRVGAEGLTNVRVVEGGFLSYEHTGPPPAAVFTRNALHQLPDFWKVVALRRIADLLEPGGVLRVRDLVYGFGPAEIDERVAGWMAWAVDDPAVGYTAEEYATHLRTEFSTFSWLFEPMLERTGFTILDREDVIGFYAAYTCRVASLAPKTPLLRRCLG
ncbi:MAG: class I SAM-dependent methyltransferase [Ilumatobacteraceae bacterium]